MKGTNRNGGMEGMAEEGVKVERKETKVRVEGSKLGWRWWHR
jgi:hypothetical protein